MFWYLARKVASAFVTLFVLLAATFFLSRLIPGGPFDSEKKQPPHIKKLQEQKYGFDLPAVVQFKNYFLGVLRGDLGPSLKYEDRPVSSIIAETLPVSLIIGFYAVVLAVVVGVPLGILSALHPNTIWDTAAMFLAISGVTLPTFLVGALLVLFFSHTLEWLPPARLETPLHYILPVVTLGLRPASIVARLIRASLLEELKMDYVRTARAKGLNERRVVLSHALRNSLLPTVTVMGPVAASVITGSFITEHFFAISGMAKHFISAVNNRDVFLIMGVTLVFAGILIVTNLLVDLSYPILDPRTRR